MNYIYSAVLGYLLGSIPTAYILLKRVYSIDITQSGSGNVGALNAYEVSRSKQIGIFVLLIDLLKGVISYNLVITLFPWSFGYAALSVFFAVFAHCYSPWIKLNGGRGLATAAGGLILFIPLFVILWMIAWLITFLISKKNIHIGNVAATIITLFASILFSDLFIRFSFPKPEILTHYIIFSIMIFSVILSKHIKPMIGLFRPIKQSK